MGIQKLIVKPAGQVAWAKPQHLCPTVPRTLPLIVTTSPGLHLLESGLSGTLRGSTGWTGLVEGALTHLCAKHPNPWLGASFKEPTSQVKRDFSSHHPTRVCCRVFYEQVQVSVCMCECVHFMSVCTCECVHVCLRERHVGPTTPPESHPRSSSL